MISALAPRYSVLTETIGSSMFGYSRTVSCLYETMPIRMTMRLITVAKTGRRMKNSKVPTSATRARLDDLDAGAVAELLMAGRDHHVGRAEAAAHLDLAGPALAERDLGQRGAALDHPVDEPLLALGEDRRFGDEHCILAPLDHDPDAREQARRQLAVGIVDARAQADRAAVDVDDGVDDVDLAFARAG